MAMQQLWQRSDRPWVWVALVLSLAAVVYLLVIPTGVLQTTTATPDGTGAVTSTQNLRLWQSEGWSVLVPLLVPAVVCGVALLAGRRWVTTTAAAFLTIGVLLSSATIGFFFLPAAVALVLAALRLRPGRLNA
jgi:hypothetical protein